jgi:hypothetical protein
MPFLIRTPAQSWSERMPQRIIPEWVFRLPPMSIPEFCAYVGWSKTKFYNEEKDNNAPNVLRKGNRATITGRALYEYEEDQRALAASRAGKREQERRAEQRQRAVRVAIAKGTHVSKQKPSAPV